MSSDAGPQHDYTARRSSLQAALKKQGAGLAVIGASDHMRYLTGWVEGGHERLVSLLIPVDGAPTFLVPAMNADQARTNPAGITRVVGWNDAAGWRPAAQQALAGYGLQDTPVALVDDELHSDHLLGFQELLPAARWLPAGETMARLRENKTCAEIAAMRVAAAIVDETVEEAIAALTAGMTETDLQDVIRDGFKRRGAPPVFDPLVCFGVNGAMPHHHTGQTRLESGDIVVLDLGCSSDHYASDITRTVAFGPPRDDDAGAVYAVVDMAYRAARAAARPGATGHEIDAAARSVITAAGFGERFIHRTGHGIGLSTHEPPYIVAGNYQELAPGMCFSIEPGIYLPGRFGVRIENIFVISRDGVESLNSEAPQTLRVVGT